MYERENDQGKKTSRQYQAQIRAQADGKCIRCYRQRGGDHATLCEECRNKIVASKRQYYKKHRVKILECNKMSRARIASLERSLAAYRAAWGAVRALAKYWMDQPIDVPRVDDIARRHGIDEKEKK